MCVHTSTWDLNEIMVLSRPRIWGSLGNSHLAEGALRPGQLWELFEHPGNRYNCFYLAPSALPERSCGKSQACGLLPVRSGPCSDC